MGEAVAGAPVSQYVSAAGARPGLKQTRPVPQVCCRSAAAAVVASLLSSRVHHKWPQSCCSCSSASCCCAQQRVSRSRSPCRAAPDTGFLFSARAVFCCLPHATTQEVVAGLPSHIKVTAGPGNQPKASAVLAWGICVGLAGGWVGALEVNRRPGWRPGA